MRPEKILACAALLLAACNTGNDEDTLRPVALAGTSLIGSYDLVDYLFEYGNGKHYDPSIVKIVGSLSITPDSLYSAEFRIDTDTTFTKRRITALKADQSQKDRGAFVLASDGSDTVAAASCAFSIQHDTLMLVTDVTKEGDPAKVGYRETAYYLPKVSASPQ